MSEELSGIIKGKSKTNEKQPLKSRNKYDFDKQYLLDGQIDNLINKLEYTPIIVNRLDYYGNSIPLGSFCFVISFVLYGFYECKVFAQPDTFTFLVLFFFWWIGQITAGIFEYIKSRTFPSVVYLLYGSYFISFFFCIYYQENYFNQECKKLFFGSWAGLSFPLLIGSFKTNIIYVLQNFSVFAFFIIRCIGECKEPPYLEF